MKRFLIALGAVLIVARPVAAQGKKEEAPGIDKAVKGAAKFERQMVVYQTFRGPVSKIATNIKGFADEFVKQGLETPTRTTPLMAIFPKSPKNPDDPVHYDIGFEVKGRVKVKPPLKVRSVKLQRAVQYKRVGAYEDLFKVHGKIDAAIRRANKSKAAGPVIHLYSNPKGKARDERIMEVVVPVNP